MTQRSIFAGRTPTVIIKAGTSVTVEGWDSDRVLAETDARAGLKVETRSEGEIGRARAAVGDRVLFDLRLKLPGGRENESSGEAIEIQISGNGKARIPEGSRVKVYAGRNAEVSAIRGGVAIVAGGDVRVHNIRSLVHASSGGSIDMEFETIEGDEAKFEAGRDLRLYVRDLTSARFIVSDLGGYWEGVIGAGKVAVRLKAGGDVTLVTDQKVEAIPPNYLMGQIERPSAGSDSP